MRHCVRTAVGQLARWQRVPPPWPLQYKVPPCVCVPQPHRARDGSSCDKAVELRAEGGGRWEDAALYTHPLAAAVLLAARAAAVGHTQATTRYL